MPPMTQSPLAPSKAPLVFSVRSRSCTSCPRSKVVAEVHQYHPSVGGPSIWKLGHKPTTISIIMLYVIL